MAMKDCPSCGADVPVSAKRCKECFHDFDEPAKTGGGWAGPIVLLVAAAGMVLVALVTLGWIVMQPQDQHIFVDQDSKTITWTKTYVTGTSTDRVKFADVTKLEYHMYAGGGYAIVAITQDGSTYVVQEAMSPLRGEATKYAKLMEKPLTEIDNTNGFGGD